jgi:hypothetical protein
MLVALIAMMVRVSVPGALLTPSLVKKIKLVVIKLAVQHPLPQSHLAVMAVLPSLFVFTHPFF